MSGPGTGRIRAEDIAEIRERVRIDEVIGDHVTLRPAGGGSLKGLCPFHDERSPSFHVTPAKGLYHCFGCQAGGDAIAFLMNLQGFTFAEAVERLADKAGIQLRYEEGTQPRDRDTGQRARFLSANRAAAQFFAEQFAADVGEPARLVMAARGFDEQACQQFGVGFAPPGWDNLSKHLRRKGFDDATLLAAGLVVEGRRGAYDRFRGRLIWPIRDLSGDVVGFGARRMDDSDDGPKYLNTPETLVYKKSQALYGIEVARREIARSQQVVVVEGYTDVMAVHLAGVTNAVATCGTAFGSDHIGVLRRILHDDGTSKGEVIFTFDSDEAGRKAALRAFDNDREFTTATYVAIDPEGLDPADLRLRHGDAAVRNLVRRRVPLYEFALRAAIDSIDVATAEGRMTGLRRAAPIIAGIKDQALLPEYARIAAGWLGLPVETLLDAVRRSGRGAPARSPGVGRTALPPGLERDALRGVVNAPVVAGPWLESVEPSAFDVGEYRTAYQSLCTAGGPNPDESEAAWLDRVLASASDADTIVLRSLAVEPLPLRPSVDEEDGATARYVESLLAKLLDRDAARRMDALTAQLAQASGDNGRSRSLQQQYRSLAGLRQQLRPMITSEEL